MSLNELPSSSSLIILDANFLLMPVQFKIDIYSRIRDIISGKIKFVILSEVVQELRDKIEREGKVKFRLEVDNSLRFLDDLESSKKDLVLRLDLKREEKMPVDDFIIKTAQKLKIESKLTNDQVYIGTNDKELKEKAIVKKIPVIFMRQKFQLVITS